MFKKGDYIVTLRGRFNLTYCAKENYCFKIAEDSKYMVVEKTTLDEPDCNEFLLFDKSDILYDWRYATEEEIIEYDLLGKPYDVTSLFPKIEKGDYLIILGKGVNKKIDQKHIGDILLVTSVAEEDGTFWICHSNPSWSGGGFRYVSKHLPLKGRAGYEYGLDFRKLTQEEINDMSKQHLNIPVTDVLKIHNIACNEWKSIIINKYLPRLDNIQHIRFIQSEVDEMFRAASSEQKIVLEEIFGKQEKPIDWSKIKTGSIVKIKHTWKHCGGIDNINSSESVWVVFFNSSHVITNTNSFVKRRDNVKYCTFNQNGKFVLFVADDEAYKEYITEVIEY